MHSTYIQYTFDKSIIESVSTISGFKMSETRQNVILGRESKAA